MTPRTTFGPTAECARRATITTPKPNPALKATPRRLEEDCQPQVALCAIADVKEGRVSFYDVRVGTDATVPNAVVERSGFDPNGINGPTAWRIEHRPGQRDVYVSTFLTLRGDLENLAREFPKLRKYLSERPDQVLFLMCVETVGVDRCPNAQSSGIS